MLIQFHLLQNYAPSNLNRDDTGSPKDTVFGGVPRGRISSQCLKRSIRKSAIFEQAFKAEGLLGERTKLLPMLLREKFGEMKAGESAMNAILSRLPEIIRGSSKSEKVEEGDADEEGEGESAKDTQERDTSNGEIKQLIFLDRKTELEAFATQLLKIYNAMGPKKWSSIKPKEIAKELGESLPRSVDIAMFGRMTTSQAFKNVEASVQVAHAISTNALKQEFDYYTAMDDLKPESEPGADMIGDVEFNSCTYYKYLNVHWEELIRNLGGDKEAEGIARRAISALLEATAMAHPSGKQNSFGAFNLPDFVLVETSERNLPVSYANAFLSPVYPPAGKSLISSSVERLSSYADRLIKAFSLEAQRAYISVDGLQFMDLKAQASLNDLKAWLKQKLL